VDNLSVNGRNHLTCTWPCFYFICSCFAYVKQPSTSRLIDIYRLMGWLTIDRSTVVSVLSIIHDWLFAIIRRCSKAHTYINVHIIKTYQMKLLELNRHGGHRKALSGSQPLRTCHLFISQPMFFNAFNHKMTTLQKWHRWRFIRESWTSPLWYLQCKKFTTFIFRILHSCILLLI